MKRWFWSFGLILMGLLLGVLLPLASPSVAQSPGLDSRVFRLESQSTQLRARIGQLETQVVRLSRATGTPAPTRPPAGTPGDESALAEDPAFRRLATLVIELRDRIEVLESQ
ncbi:MAG: hypothetical protein KME20_05055 [Kaiparowitsia implicata GSE-PSE-MK54-09C]|nr:hypothetical protein [Kaiparowitsia implicata GSE-PSE-MK54-09C]